MIGPWRGLFYDWAGESFGWVDAYEQDWSYPPPTGAPESGTPA
jgi:hypothetical protein